MSRSVSSSSDWIGMRNAASSSTGSPGTGAGGTGPNGSSASAVRIGSGIASRDGSSTAASSLTPREAEQRFGARALRRREPFEPARERLAGDAPALEPVEHLALDVGPLVRERRGRRERGLVAQRGSSRTARSSSLSADRTVFLAGAESAGPSSHGGAPPSRTNSSTAKRHRRPRRAPRAAAPCARDAPRS